MVFIAVLYHALKLRAAFCIFTTEMWIEVFLNDLNVVFKSILAALAYLSFQGLIRLVATI